MKHSIYKEGESRTVGDAHIVNILTSASCAQISIARANLQGHHGPTANLSSLRAYYILDGRADVTIDGCTLAASKGDVIVVPTGAIHEIDGHVEYLVINTPAFNPEDERAIDRNE